MHNLDEKYASGMEPPGQSFSETAVGLIKWKVSGLLEGGEQVGVPREGADEIRQEFVSQGGSEDGPDRMIRVLDFLALRMNLDDDGKLRSDDVLRKLLSGGYDEDIDESELASRGQAYSLALYLYMHTSSGSEEEMCEALKSIIDGYDDPNGYYHEHDYYGLSSEPILAKLCSKAIEMHDLGQDIRNKYGHVLGVHHLHDSVDMRNAREVLQRLDNEGQQP